MDDLTAEDEIRELRARVQRLEEENAQLRASQWSAWVPLSTLPQTDQSSQQQGRNCPQCGTWTLHGSIHVCLPSYAGSNLA